MQPGKYKKDGSIRSYIDIICVRGDIAYGICYLKSYKQDLNGLKELTWVHLDESPKVWMISMHSWQPFLDH